MSHIPGIVAAGLLWLCSCGAAVERQTGLDAQMAGTLSMGGAGGLYLLAEPGELWVEVEKRDLNARDRHIDLRAILVGPDRRVLQEEVIPEDGLEPGAGPGPVGRVRLQTQVERAGIYAVNLTATQDRYGEDHLWGFRTNCPRYLIETSRGHRDARHLEPIVLAAGGQDRAGAPADVCFAPRLRPQLGPLHIEAEGLPPGSGDLVLYDAAGRQQARLPVDGEGRASASLDLSGRSSEELGPGPWRLHLPVGQATLHVDQVTRWERDDPYANLSLWTDRPEAWFDLAAHRWMLTPYSHTVYGQPGQEVEANLLVHNNGPVAESYDLTLEFDGDAWAAELSTATVHLDPGEKAPVVWRGAVPLDGEGTRACHVRVTPRRASEISTYSTVYLHRGAAPWHVSLSLPLYLRPYCHENEQLGYLREFPVANELYFDLQNRPVLWAGQGVTALLEGQWNPMQIEGESLSRGGRPACTKVAFDRDGDLYAVGLARGRATLLHSADGGRTARTYELGAGGGSLDLEQWSGHNPLDGPPPALHAIQVEADPERIWRKICTLDLYLPRKAGAELVMGPPIRLSDTSLGVGSHSGIPSAVVSRGDMVHAIWAEPTDPEEDVPGVPTYVATYNRATKVLGQPALIGYGAPPNDVHNRPSITMDSQGYLHALAGTHGQPFQYARSLAPNDAGQGWTEPVPVGDRQTYIGLVCGPDDVLHLVYRYWRYGEEPHPHSHHATLAYQRKEPGQPWSEPRVLVAAPFSEYSIFYHKLTIDRRGRLFLSYDYWSTFWFYRNDTRSRQRSVMMSPDGGDTWKLAGAADLD